MASFSSMPAKYMMCECASVGCVFLIIEVIANQSVYYFYVYAFRDDNLALDNELMCPSLEKTVRCTFNFVTRNLLPRFLTCYKEKK